MTDEESSMWCAIDQNLKFTHYMHIMFTCINISKNLNSTHIINTCDNIFFKHMIVIKDKWMFFHNRDTTKITIIYFNVQLQSLYCTKLKVKKRKIEKEIEKNLTL